MISQLTGNIIDKQPPIIIMDVNGVGYEVHVSMQTFYTLPAVGEKLRLYTQLIVREDAHLLFGFANTAERETFRLLIKVSGIGAKTALGILSVLSSDDLARAIADEDIKVLSSVPGIGKKTAERLALELRGKLHIGGAVDMPEGLFTPKTDTKDDIISTLLALGYNEREANAATKTLPADCDVSEGVRLALKNMLK
ncbi:MULTISPECIES: Holliday junction branch migration protein RuvA [Vitreoscilla]|uniref:Holliday junction branch migration complex subunit RuvA n=1 Tax=Vitreoscilla stercoraria TaxID=61 RepID=A0ABY4E9C7_VITST|nr:MULTISPECIES: Holliday junction branch migration protein RuvA [Vitreoscilla]AUZ06283.1 Holliday junction ATP-dependent DNA helicase RuvA [Vitreoscilla sp. C1]UOO92364.1 Holliday junction branch migration protein RuvA [Vitreoscilla stercoraria]